MFSWVFGIPGGNPKTFINTTTSRPITMGNPLAVDPQQLIVELAQELKDKKLVQPTDWAKFVKTGHSRERAPDDPDWWYHRAASILRTVYRLGPIGTSKLRTKYSSRKNRGYKTEHTYKGSGAIVRKILQQLEKSGLIKPVEKGVHKGRVITGPGEALLSAHAKEPKSAPKKEAA